MFGWRMMPWVVHSTATSLMFWTETILIATSSPVATSVDKCTVPWAPSPSERLIRYFLSGVYVSGPWPRDTIGSRALVERSACAWDLDFGVCPCSAIGSRALVERSAWHLDFGVCPSWHLDFGVCPSSGTKNHPWLAFSGV